MQSDMLKATVHPQLVLEPSDKDEPMKHQPNVVSSLVDSNKVEESNYNFN
jgi:hypothetical protein